MTSLNRRKLLRRIAQGGLTLTAFATGLPITFLRNRRVYGQGTDSPDRLIMLLSDRGDPLNANAPGSYIPGVVNNPLGEMAPQPVRLGDRDVTAARPWAETLSDDLRGRLAFFHMTTGTVAHNQFDEALRLGGAVKGEGGTGVREEELPSAIAQEAAPLLQTVLADPLALGPDRLSSRGLPLENIDPRDLRNLFLAPSASLADLSSLRDQALDAMYSDLRQNGTPAQRTFLDQYARGQAEARALGEQLADLLSEVSDNAFNAEARGRNQLIAAMALLQLDVTPVVTLYLPFGNDNHNDAGLTDEADEYQTGVALIQELWTRLGDGGLRDRTTVASLFVFGRTLQLNDSGGRDHNGAHHVSVMFGPRVRPGVVGGLTSYGNGVFGATGIDPSSGEAATEGPIPPSATLSAWGRTLMRAVGLPDEAGVRRLPSGRVVEGALLG
jgi:hypothetical protein